MKIMGIGKITDNIALKEEQTVIIGAVKPCSSRIHFRKTGSPVPSLLIGIGIADNYSAPRVQFLHAGI
jgi:hypothetical protein